MIDSDRLFIALLLAMALMWQPLLAQAAMPSSVYISEIGWAGSSKSQADEWLEFTNNTDEQIDPGLWVLEGAGTSGGSVTIPEGTIIKPYSTFLIANYDADHDNSTLATAPDYSTTALSLSNSAFKLTLRNAAGVVADEVGDGGKPPAGGMNENGGATSMVRTLNGWEAATAAVGFDEGAPDVGTPGMLDEFDDEHEETEESLADEQTEETESLESSETESPGSDTSSTEPSEAVATESSGDETMSESESSSAPTIYPVGTLVISDWLADPPDDESEWVEVFNPYNNVIPLDGWHVREGAGRRVALPDQLLGREQGVRVTFSGSALNNDGDTIELLDPSGVVIDEVTYEPEPELEPETESEAETNSVILTPSEVEGEGSSTMATSEDSSSSRHGGTPQNDKVEVASVSFAGLRLSEIYPNTDGPDAEHEFIELENIGESAIDLFEMILEDAAGSSWSINQHLMIDPNEQIAFFRSAFGFALNNTGQETVRLISQTGELLDSISYENPSQAFALVRINGLWDWTTTPTPDEPNQISEPSPELADTTESVAGTSQTESAVAISIEEIRDEPRGSDVRVVGVVTATPGTLGDQVMYLSGAGIQLYKHDGEWPELAVGDLVEVTGMVSSNRGETRIKIGKNDTLEVLEEGQSIAPVRVTSLSEEHEGRLVTVQGLVRKAQKDRIELEVDGVEVSVRIKEGADIDTEDIAAGDLVEVTGIVSQTDGREHLLPRSIEDIHMIETSQSVPVLSGKEAEAKRHTLRGVGLILAALVFLTALYVRHRRRHRRAPSGAPGRLPEPTTTRV